MEGCLKLQEDSWSFCVYQLTNVHRMFVDVQQSVPHSGAGWQHPLASKPLERYSIIITVAKPQIASHV